MRSWIPNLITLGSLSAGFASMLLTTHGLFHQAAFAILVAGLLDGLDGRVARLLGVSSPLGMELDSLADIVSFGTAPALLLYALDLHSVGVAGGILAAFLVACAAYRLARFNLGTPPGYFVGLPTTAAGGIVASFVIYGPKINTFFYPVLAFTLAILMISHLPYRDFKRVDLTHLRRSKVFLVVAVASAVALVSLRKLIFLPLTAYLLFGPKDGLLAAKGASARAGADTGTSGA